MSQIIFDTIQTLPMQWLEKRHRVEPPSVITGGKVSMWLQRLSTNHTAGCPRLLDWNLIKQSHLVKLVSKRPSNMVRVPLLTGCCAESWMWLQPAGPHRWRTILSTRLRRNPAVLTPELGSARVWLHAAAPTCNQHVTHRNSLTFNSSALWPLDPGILGFAPSGLWLQGQRAVGVKGGDEEHLAAALASGGAGATWKGWSAACLWADAGRVGPPIPDRLQH